MSCYLSDSEDKYFQHIFLKYGSNILLFTNCTHFYKFLKQNEYG